MKNHATPSSEDDVVTPQKAGVDDRQSRSLQIERERLSLAAAATGAGIWDYDIDADHLYCDNRWYEILGLDPARPITSIAEFRPHIHPDDVERATEVKATFAELMASRENYHITFRIIRPDGSIRWLRSAACLIKKSPESSNRAVGAVVDVTEQVTTQAALAESERLFKLLADTVPQIIFSSAADGTIDYLNKRWREFTNTAGPIDATSWQAFLHPDDRERTITAWQHAVETGQRYEIDYRYRHHSGEYRWSHAEAMPLREEDGRVARWFGSVTDIHQAKLLEIERELVARELDHRVKNMFALLDALISLSVRDDPTMAPYADRLQRRLSALTKAHNLIWEGDRGASMSLHALLRELLEPYENHVAMRISLMGTDIGIDSTMVTPLALIFHELATNAAKYGALQTPTGKLNVNTIREADWVRIIWTEQGMPAASASVRYGFGSKLLELIIHKQFRGNFSREFMAEGASIQISIPLMLLESRTSR